MATRAFRKALKETDNWDLLHLADTCFFCKEFAWERPPGTVGRAVCNKRMQPALPRQNDITDDLEDAIPGIEPPCTLHNPDADLTWVRPEVAVLPERTRKIEKELRLRIARAALKGTLSPDYTPPWPLTE